MVLRNNMWIYGRLSVLLILMTFILCSCGGSKSYENTEQTESSLDGYTEQTEASSNGYAGQASVFHIKMIKIGKADTALLYMEGETEAVVIDTGEDDDGPEIVDKLEELGITKISRLIITHYDKDHIGGAAYVLEHIPVEQVIQPDYPKTEDRFEAYKEAVNSYVSDVYTISEDMDFSEGPLSFSVYPENDPENRYFEEGEDNDRSLVVMVSYQGKKFLFAGDIEEKRIELLLASGVDLSCDWIKVPHHGNFNSQTENLLKAAGAKDGIICCSEKNPADKETLDAIQRAEMTCWITSDGDITFTCDGEGIYGEQE